MRICVVLLLTALSYSLYAQNVGIGIEEPTATLHLENAVSNQIEWNEGFESGMINPAYLSGSHNWYVESGNAQTGSYALRAPQIILPTTGAGFNLPFFIPKGKTAKIRFSYKAIFNTQYSLTYETNNQGTTVLSESLNWQVVNWEMTGAGLPDTLFFNFLPTENASNPQVYIDNIEVIYEDGHGLRITDGKQGRNHLLVSDDLGNAQWRDVISEISDSIAASKQHLVFQNDNKLSISEGNEVEISALRSGLSQLELANNGGLRWGTQNQSIGQYSTAWGFRDTAIGQYSTAWGYDNISSGFVSTSWGRTNVAQATFSTAWGIFSKAQGEASTSWGLNTIASGNYSTAFGRYTNATRVGSLATGEFSQATGIYSSAFGQFTIANSFGQVSFGRFNDTLTSPNPQNWINEDQLFVVGNGASSASRNNALQILKNGNTTIGHWNLNTINNQLTWGFSNNVTSGIGATTWGNHNESNAYLQTTIGRNNETLSNASPDSWVGDDHLFVIGNGTTSSKRNALEIFKNGDTRIEHLNLDVSKFSMNWGGQCLTDGYRSTSWGLNNSSKGFYSTSWGRDNLAESFLQTVFGRNNVSSPAAAVSVWVETEPLFVVGNGTDVNNRHNAFTLLKNGHTGIGIAAPTEALQVAGKVQSVLPVGQKSHMGVFELYNGTLFGFEFEYDGSTDLMHLWSRGFSGNEGKRMTFTKTGRVGFKDSNPSYTVELPNSAADGTARAYSWTTYSDARVKKNVLDLEIGLKEVLQLRPKSYDHHTADFKDGQLEILAEHEATIGLLAQEVNEIIPGIVFQPEDEQADLWSLDYEKIIPVLIKAIQEQEAERQSLESRIEVLEKLILQQQGIMAELAE